MLKMRNAISSEFLATIDENRWHTEVQCLTCHRGQPRPEMLEDLLWQVIRDKDVDAAITKYRELRKQYYGGFAYDFGDGPLNRLAKRIAIEGFGADEVIAVYELNLEFHPASGMAHLGVAELYQRVGQKDKAIESLVRVPTIWPDYPGVEEKIEELKAK